MCSGMCTDTENGWCCMGLLPPAAACTPAHATSFSLASVGLPSSQSVTVTSVLLTRFVVCPVPDSSGALDHTF